MAPATEVRLSDLVGPAYWPLHRRLRDGDIWDVWLPGGRASLKSSTVAIETLLGMELDPDKNTVAMRRYAADLGRSVSATYQWACRMLGLSDSWDWLSSPHMGRHKKTGQLIMMLGADDPESTKSLTWARGRTGYLWCEEVTQFRGSEDLRNIRQSVVRGAGNIVSFFTFNPPKSAKNWANAEVARVEAARDPKRIVLRTTYLQAPAAWLGEQAIALAEVLRQTDELRWRNEYLGEVIGIGSEVFTNIELREMDDGEIAVLPNFRQGLDWGYAIDPVAMMRTAYDRKRRILYIIGEVSGIGKTNRILDAETPEAWKRDLTRADSAEPKSIEEMRGEFGWKIAGATKGPGSVETGIKWLQGLSKIVIDPRRCPLAAREFPDYALEMDRSGELISRYPDRDNHTIDGVRYGCEDLMLPEKEAVKVAPPPPMAHHWG